MARYIVRQDHEGDWNLFDQEEGRFATQYVSSEEDTLSLVEAHAALAEKLHQIRFAEETAVMGRLEARGYTIIPPGFSLLG